MARRTHQLTVDRLETRDLMAGNLSATVSLGTLYVKEASGSTNTDNGVQITRLSNGLVRVSGVPAASGTPTTVNGADFKDFFVPFGKLNVKLGGGDDVVTVRDGRFNTVSINVGAPGLTDTDHVFVSGVKTQGLVHIVTGGGNDRVSVRDSVIGDGVGTTSDDLSIFTGAGSDTVEVGSADSGFVEVAGNVRVATYSSVSEAGDDTVSINSALVSKLIGLDLGAGNDTLTVENSFGGTIVALAGTGNDRATLTEVRAGGSFFVDMSLGNDSLDMVYLRAIDLGIHGGTGFDRLTHYLDGPTVTKSVTGWESINSPLPPIAGGIVIGDLPTLSH